MKSLPCAVAILTAWAFVVSPARAQVSDDERARAHFHAGESYFAQGRYADAAEQFDEAYRLSGRAPLLANASVAFERAGNLPMAIERLEAFLASDAPEVESTRVTSATRLESLRARLAAQVESNRDEEPSVEPLPASAPAEEPGATMRIAGLALGGAGLGLGVTSLALGLRARGIHGELTDVCGPNGDECPLNRADDIDRGRRFSRLSAATAAGSVVTLGAGTALYLLGRRVRGDERSASVVLDVTPDRVVAIAYGSF